MSTAQERLQEAQQAAALARQEVEQEQEAQHAADQRAAEAWAKVTVANYAAADADLRRQQQQALDDFGAAVRESPWGAAWLRMLAIRQQRIDLSSDAMNAAARLGLIDAGTGRPKHGAGITALGSTIVQPVLEVVEEALGSRRPSGGR